MAGQPVTMHQPWQLRIPAAMAAELEAHLFPGDADEHGAVLVASMVTTPRGVRLLGRHLGLACDGVDYVAGNRGYRMLTPRFVQDQILKCASSGLVYLAVHCHKGSDTVAFSATDLASHERGYPALLDIADGPPVGALVFAGNAVAGDIWRRNGSRVALEDAVVAGLPLKILRAAPPPRPRDDPTFDRQSRLFGDRGQAVLASQKVGVVGAGGAGSLLVEYLARLGVGHLVVIDPDRIERSNHPRVVGSRRRDSMHLLTAASRPRAVRALGHHLATRKVMVARRVALGANPDIAFDGISADVTDPAVARMLIDCDYLFLAADSMRARLVFNALVHQYVIPGVEVGAKIQLGRDGSAVDVFSVVRPVLPGFGCLWCNGLIDPARLQEESTSGAQLGRQRYVDDAEVHAPSVITLNAVAAAHAANEYMLSVTGMLPLSYQPCWQRFHATTQRSIDRAITEIPRRDAACTECSTSGRLGAGNARRLPTH
ncbi:ThiF family adenylyltransferase [Mycolicibacterium celeriflavum]|uniref:ThiF family adenylyltransferase n=1 Tax=Mycolicibacterium celeriflavum TaxID=1249101 RepID=UPI003CF91725